ncbi:MAG: hypothetical protein MI861_05715, partial [Pirellulales bacterium]|nr:hypothetical protein [Pirellulales bacterium]
MNQTDNNPAIQSCGSEAPKGSKRNWFKINKGKHIDVSAPSNGQIGGTMKDQNSIDSSVSLPETEKSLGETHKTTANVPSEPGRYHIEEQVDIQDIRSIDLSAPDHASPNDVAQQDSR